MYFTKYEDAKRLNPSTASVVLDSKKGINRRRYVEALNEKRKKGYTYDYDSCAVTTSESVFDRL